MRNWFNLYFALLAREIRTRFVGSATGWLWLVLTPLLLLGVYAFVFGVIFQARLPEDLGIPFIAWLAVALWPWLAFADSISRGSQAVVGNAALIGKVALRRELLPLAAASAVFVLHLAGYLFVLVVVHWLAADIQWLTMPLLPVVLIPTFLAAMGFVLLLSALQVFLRDVEHALPTLLMIWFFLTPILYAPQMLPEAMLDVFAYNPMYWVMEQVRAIVLFGDWRPGLVDALLWLGSILLFALGWVVFQRLSPHFEDFL